MGDLYREATTRYILSLDELIAAESFWDLLACAPLPQTPSCEGQTCAVCGAPATVVEVRPFDVASMLPDPEGDMRVQVTQRYRFVCDRPHGTAK